MIWFRQMAQFSTHMSQVHKATAFHFFNSNRLLGFPSPENAWVFERLNRFCHCMRTFNLHWCWFVHDCVVGLSVEQHTRKLSRGLRKPWKIMIITNLQKERNKSCYTQKPWSIRIARGTWVPKRKEHRNIGISRLWTHTMLLLSSVQRFRTRLPQIRPHSSIASSMIHGDEGLRGTVWKIWHYSSY